MSRYVSAVQDIENVRLERGTQALTGELATRSEHFWARWAAHDVHEFRGGKKTLHHQVVGTLELDWESVQLTADEGPTMSIYSAEPASETAERRRLLGSWAGTPPNSRR